MGSKLVIGIDEAGYGPSIGPFVVVATVWRAPSELSVEDLEERLQPEFQARPLVAIRTGATRAGSHRAANPAHIPLGDSKKIYAGKYAEEGLQLGARFLLETVSLANKSESHDSRQADCDENPDKENASWGDGLYPSDWLRIKSVPWLRELDLRLQTSPPHCESPINVYPELFQLGISKLSSLGIELIGASGRLIDEIEWNRLIKQYQNKSLVLSELSLGLARDVVAAHAITNEPIEIYCDKHGGRNRYQAHLMKAFDNEWFEALAETSQLSRYSAKWEGHPLMIQFRVEGDSIIPSAAASILAKWTREKSMETLNAYWAGKSETHGYPAPKPTAGYYVDAVRFAKDIESLATKHGPSKSAWWRIK
jgi:ribonuclease HII